MNNENNVNNVRRNIFKSFRFLNKLSLEEIDLKFSRVSNFFLWILFYLLEIRVNLLKDKLRKLSIRLSIFSLIYIFNHFLTIIKLTIMLIQWWFTIFFRNLSVKWTPSTFPIKSEKLVTDRVNSMFSIWIKLK